MNDTMIIEVRTVYGVEKFYPACDLSTKFALLLGQTTLTKDNLRIIGQMGVNMKLTHKFTSEQPFL